jgi:hypothetical protein
VKLGKLWRYRSVHGALIHGYVFCRVYPYLPLPPSVFGNHRLSKKFTAKYVFQRA